MIDEKRTQFDYLLNALQHASQSDKPAEHGYAEKRRALFAYVRGLEARQSADGAPAVARGWPADKDAEPVPMPKLPPGIVMHPQVGELFDRLAMHTYAMGYAMACAAAGVGLPDGGRDASAR